MPIYVYETIRNDGKAGKRFEIQQQISDPPLTNHPKTGEPVRRIIVSAHFLNNQFDKLNKKFIKQDKGKPPRGLEL